MGMNGASTSWVGGRVEGSTRADGCTQIRTGTALRHTPSVIVVNLLCLPQKRQVRWTQIQKMAMQVIQMTITLSMMTSYPATLVERLVDRELKRDGADGCVGLSVYRRSEAEREMHDFLMMRISLTHVFESGV